jgi:DNA-3-methyladenine glycosylase I
MAAEPKRCFWVSLDKPYYVEYHDTEWGRPLRDDRALFELLTLEGCQAGLSWITVLRKHEHYGAFAGSILLVARFTRRALKIAAQFRAGAQISRLIAP